MARRIVIVLSLITCPLAAGLAGSVAGSEPIAAFICGATSVLCLLIPAWDATRSARPVGCGRPAA